MAFGIKSTDTANADSYKETNKVDVAELKNSDGVIIDFHTHSGKKEVSEDVYLAAETSTITNEATNGQSGATDIVTEHSLEEKQTEYQKVTKTKVSALPAKVS